MVKRKYSLAACNVDAPHIWNKFLKINQGLNMFYRFHFFFVEILKSLGLFICTVVLVVLSVTYIVSKEKTDI